VRWFIPNGGTLLLVIALIATAQVWARPLASPTGTPGPSATTVNYQGRLSDSDGVPLDGTYGMSFALYDAATDGNLVWGPEEHTAVEVSDGLFSVGLGSKTSGGIPTTTWNGDRYLEITVGGETLEPRELIRSVPIAGMALTVPDGAMGTDQIADGAVTQAKLGSDINFEPPDGSITTGKLADGAVTASKAALSHGYVVGEPPDNDDPARRFYLDTTFQDVPGLSFSVNPTTDQVLHLNVMLDATATSGSGPIVGLVYVNGSSRGAPIVFNADDVRASISLPVQINLSPGSYNIKFKARVESGPDESYLYSENCVMSYIMFAQ
jgi:hypothetical protein